MTADHALVVQSGLKELAARRELLATFIAKPSADRAVNVHHLHVILRNNKGTPVVYDSEAEHGLLRASRHFSGLVLATVPESTAACAECQLLPARPPVGVGGDYGDAAGGQPVRGRPSHQ